MKILLILPPIFPPTEPPAGLARLAGALSHHGQEYDIWDANLEMIRHFLGLEPQAEDRDNDHIAPLRGPVAYQDIKRYSVVVAAMNQRLLAAVGKRGERLSMTDFRDPDFSPLKSSDLLRMAEHPEKNMFFPWFSKRMIDVMEDYRPGMIGFSIISFSQALTAFAMIGFVRARFPEIPIVIGGGLVTSWDRTGALSAAPFAGLVGHTIVGMGESALLGVLGQSTVGGDCSYTPDYNRFRSLPYIAPSFVLPYSTASGCYYRKCSFCPETAEKNSYIPNQADCVIDDVQSLTQKYAPSLIHFLDSAISPAMMKKLIANPPDVPWYSFARVEPQLEDPDFCLELRRAGCVMLQLGIESGSQKILDAMCKGIRVEQTEKVLANLREVGILTYVYLMFGTMAETIAEARKTLDFVRRNNKNITFLNLAKFNLPVESEEAETVRTFATDTDGEMSCYTFFEHPLGWDRDQVRYFLNNEFFVQPEVRTIMQRVPPSFGSLHAAFFHDVLR